MMMSALKITAERMALSGVARRMMLSTPSTGYVVANAAGMIAKYLATSLAMLKVVSAPRVISICLPVSTTSRSLVGLESRSTMLPASLAAWVPLFMATATSAWASAGASLVPSPVIATSRPSACMSADQLELGLRRRLGEEIVHPRLRADRRRRQRIVAGDHDGLDAHPAELGEALADPALDDVLELDRRRAPWRRRRRPAGVAPALAIVSTAARTSLGTDPPRLPDVRLDGVGGALADLPPVQVHAAHARLRGEGDERGPELLDLALADPVLLLGEDDDAPALRRLVGEGGELGGVGEIALRDARSPG